MSIVLNIDADIDTDDMEFESARILRDIATRIEVGYDGGTVHDPDGNDIGTWALN